MEEISALFLQDEKFFAETNWQGVLLEMTLCYNDPP